MSGPLGSAALASSARVGIVGAGAMGGGIAQVAMLAGHDVVLTDADPAALGRAQAAISNALAREVGKGRLLQSDAADALARLRLVPGVASPGGFSECALAIEAVIERLDAKQDLFRSLESVVSPECILATNTSSLSIASIAAACSRPQRVVGMHFFNPAPVMPLVEVVPGLRTSPETTLSVIATATRWGKTPVRASDTPGFIVNRVARPYYAEALRLYDEGFADMATIDWAMTTLAGFRMGPFELMDFIGHDVNYIVTESVWTAMYYDPRYRPSVTQKRLVEAGLLGRKSGQGFYAYADGANRPAATTDAATGAAIVRRVLAMLINEAVEAVHLRVASRADIELAMTRGVNYPKGLLAWGDELGPAEVLAELDRLQGETGDDRYRASVLLRRHVRDATPLAP